MSVGLAGGGYKGRPGVRGRGRMGAMGETGVVAADGWAWFVCCCCCYEGCAVAMKGVLLL